MSKISRYEEVSNLLEAGLSYAEIGRRWNISRQRVWQIANKNPGNIPRPKLMFTTGDVARHLGIPANTVRYWADKGILKSSRIGPRGDRRFKRDDITSFTKKR
jgi:excisionase family DNA binding protein